MSEIQVTHIRVAGPGRAPWESWVTHLCNDELGIQVPIHTAELNIEFGHKRYFIRVDGAETDLHLVEYLTTYPNARTEDNLSSLPDIED